MAKVPIIFHMVKGHTGDLWNTYVDKLTRDTGMVGGDLIHVNLKDLTDLMELLSKQEGGTRVAKLSEH